jgi:hypothetical protein
MLWCSSRYAIITGRNRKRAKSHVHVGIKNAFVQKQVRVVIRISHSWVHPVKCNIFSRGITIQTTYTAIYGAYMQPTLYIYTSYITAPSQRFYWDGAEFKARSKQSLILDVLFSEGVVGVKQC